MINRLTKFKEQFKGYPIVAHNERKRRKKEFWTGVAMVEMIEEFSKDKRDHER